MVSWSDGIACHVTHGKDLLNPGMGRMNGSKSSEARSVSLIFANAKHAQLGGKLESHSCSGGD